MRYALDAPLVVAEAHAARVRSLEVDFDGHWAKAIVDFLGADDSLARTTTIGISAAALDALAAGGSFEAALLQLAVQHDSLLKTTSGQVEVG